MAKATRETMMIAFPRGGILPAEVTGGLVQSVGPHEAVEVPRSYGEHLVADRLAYRPMDVAKNASGNASQPGRVA